MYREAVVFVIGGVALEIKCLCGNLMSDSGSPNETENLLISNKSIEVLQDLVDSQVEREGIVDEWPEHWERSHALVVWKCHMCKRLYISPKGSSKDVTVYAIETIGIK